MIQMANVVKFGTHGTSSDRAKKIARDGFRPSSGRGGSGIYFWAKSRYSHDLAVSWFKQCRDEGRYEQAPKPTCVVISAKLEAPEEKWLDLENPDLKEALLEQADARGLLQSTKTKEISGLYDLFISRLEDKLTKKFKIILLKVATPKSGYCGFYPMAFAGAPVCFIVRESSCIETLNQVEVPDA